MKKSKILWYLIIVLVTGSFTFIPYLIGKKTEKNFFSNSVNKKIIRVDNYFNKSYRMYYDDKNWISSLEIKEILKVGDSISKAQNSFIFRVYRISDSGYKLYKVFILR